MTRRWAPSAVWGAVILVATSLPGSMLPAGPAIPAIDKVVHVTLYGTLAVFVALASPARSWRATGLTIGAIFAFAAADEWHQQWIPGRGADALDWMADVAGATIGFSLTRTAQARRETRT